MTQEFNGFLTCAVPLPFTDDVGLKACMVKYGYDPGVYSPAEAISLAYTQRKYDAEHPPVSETAEIALLGVGVIVITVVAFIVSRIFRGKWTSISFDEGKMLAPVRNCQEPINSGSELNRWNINNETYRYFS